MIGNTKIAVKKGGLKEILSKNTLGHLGIKPINAAGTIL
jgi:hypothetical protein